jgi:hypothetical protein
MANTIRLVVELATMLNRWAPSSLSQISFVQFVRVHAIQLHTDTDHPRRRRPLSESL